MLAFVLICVAVSAALVLLFLLEIAPGRNQLVAQRLAEMQSSGRDTPAILEAFVLEYYGNAPSVPPQIVVPRDAEGRMLPATPLVADAHAAGLQVHPWTFRRENVFLPADFRSGDITDPAFLHGPGDLRAEIAAYLAVGVDGVFSDNPDVAVKALQAAR